MKRILSLFLAVLTLVAVVLGTSSCTLAGTGTGSDTVSGNVNLVGGDTYNVTINDPPASTASAAAKAMLSAVSITSAYTMGSGGIGYQYGSGVIYKMDAARSTAYLVTNYHVVYNATYGISQNIGVFLYGKESADYAIKAEYIGGSMYYDIAVLKIQNSRTLMESEAVAATFANSDEMSLLDTVIAVGNASGKGLSATVGHINVDSEYINLIAADDRTQTTIRVMRTDAAVNPGNSGGGLFNVRGEVIGIVNAKSSDDSIDNIGYAIPSNVAKSIVENLIYVELNSLDKDDFKKILTIPQNAITTQYQELLKVDNIDLEFTDDAIDAIAELAADENETRENIGARRLQTIMELLLEDISFNASDENPMVKVTIDKPFVLNTMKEIIHTHDFKKYVL